MDSMMPVEISDVSRAISAAAFQAYEKRLLAEIMDQPLPQHIAVIMDGNRRFAREISLKPLDGHMKGKNKLEEVLEWCMETNIKILTVYAFSTENFNRDSDEVNTLMGLFAKGFNDVIKDERVHKHKIRIRALGQRNMLPEPVQKAIENVEEKTEEYDNYNFNIAIAYGGREEIMNAIKEIAKEVRAGNVEPEDIDSSYMAKFLYTGGLPDPDLVLRTSGEERISNFLLWQLAYSELYFTDVYWPKFKKIDFLRAIRSYQLRKRRYGK